MNRFGYHGFSSKILLLINLHQAFEINYDEFMNRENTASLTDQAQLELRGYRFELFYDVVKVYLNDAYVNSIQSGEFSSWCKREREKYFKLVVALD